MTRIYIFFLFIGFFTEEPLDKDGTMAEIKEDVIDEVGSECDREVSKIDFSGVTMRSKKMRAVEENMPRPMSWEGGLSDTEMKQVTLTVLRYYKFECVQITKIKHFS